MSRPLPADAHNDVFRGPLPALLQALAQAGAVTVCLTGDDAYNLSETFRATPAPYDPRFLELGFWRKDCWCHAGHARLPRPLPSLGR